MIHDGYFFLKHLVTFKGEYYFPYRASQVALVVKKSESESEVTQSSLTLCDPMDCILLGSSIHGIFQARILEWVAISFSRGSSWPRDPTQVSCIVGRSFTIWATREVSGQEPTCKCMRCVRGGFHPWVGRIPWRRAWQPNPVFLLGESHGQRSLVGYSPWGHRIGHDWSDLAHYFPC